MDNLQNCKDFLRKSSRIVILTGAGMSTESGISDYRSQGGLWHRYQPITIQEFMSDAACRKEYWARKKDVFSQILNAKPHDGHRALVRLQRENKILGVITQNIDGLHQKSGLQNVLEIHGTNLEAVCLTCQSLFPFADIFDRLCEGEEIPHCACGGFLKANTISFGQELDGNVLRRAIEWAKKCDLFLAIGSSLVVEPAASLPVIAKEAGGKLMIINLDITPLDRFADLCAHSPIAETLKNLVD